MIGAIILALAIVPNPKLTPGTTQPITVEVLCATKWGKDARHVTEKMKRDIAAAYSLKRSQVVAYGKGKCCEFDHLISRELGGTDDVKNIWVQPWVAAKRKDRLENRLHVLVCKGELSLPEAQHAIATDWPAAYTKYVEGK